jgi:hypothetical protein
MIGGARLNSIEHKPGRKGNHRLSAVPGKTTHLIWIMQVLRKRNRKSGSKEDLPAPSRSSRFCPFIVLRSVAFSSNKSVPK